MNLPEVPKYFSYFSSLLLTYSIEKEFKMEKKSSWVVFSAAGPGRRQPWPISAREPAC
jgi:hypothetical protein